MMAPSHEPQSFLSPCRNLTMGANREVARSAAWRKCPPVLDTVTPVNILVVFDFDCTLTQLHMYNELRQPSGQMQKQRNPDAFYERIFGGQERIQALCSFIRTIRQHGCALRIMSFGYAAEIWDALSHIGVIDAFEDICGNKDYKQHGVRGPAPMKPQMLAVYQSQCTATQNDSFFLRFCCCYSYYSCVFCPVLLIATQYW